MRVEAGDWVAFQRDGEIVYARAVYVRKMERYPYTLEAITTAGTVDVERVLEARAAEVREGQP